MKVIFIIVGLIVAVVVVFVLYRYLTVKRQNNQLNEQQFERIKPLHDKLKNGQPVTEQEVRAFAENILTRETTYLLLQQYNKTHLFPKELYTIVKGAESNLATWLEFPTELGACPDEIGHVKRVTLDFDGQNNFVHYEVFKYRVNEPHWAAKNGWILGVVGPYFDDSNPYDFPHATFSRIGVETTPEEEAKWVHENISLRK